MKPTWLSSLAKPIGERVLEDRTTTRRAIGGACRRRAQQTPPFGDTGALPTGIITGGPGIP